MGGHDEQERAGRRMSLDTYATVWTVISEKVTFGGQWTDAHVIDEFMCFGVLPSVPALSCATTIAARAIQDLAAARGLTVEEQIDALNQDVRWAALLTEQREEPS